MGMFVAGERRRGRGRGQGARTAWLLPALLIGSLVGLAGCGDRLERFYSSRLPFDTPIDWWHQLQGGVIAEERPPPPNADQPYASIDQIPARPTPTSAATRAALSARLANERGVITRQAAQDPLTAFKPAVPPAPQADAPPMAQIEAASAAPAPRVAAPLPAPAAPAAIRQAAAPEAARPAAPTEPVVSGPVPALPSAPPPAPSLPGIPASTFQPATPRPQPQAVIAFLPGSAVLRPESDAALRALAARRGGGPVAVLGGGDAASASPEAQAAALPLAWRRVQAMQTVLAQAGVPESAMRVDAAALGRGGVARLVN